LNIQIFFLYWSCWFTNYDDKRIS